jgi:hypothetical protein
LIAENCLRGRDYGGVRKGLRGDLKKGLRDSGVKELRKRQIDE